MVNGRSVFFDMGNDCVFTVFFYRSMVIFVFVHDLVYFLLRVISGILLVSLRRKGHRGQIIIFEKIKITGRQV